MADTINVQHSAKRNFHNKKVYLRNLCFFVSFLGTTGKQNPGLLGEGYDSGYDSDTAWLHESGFL